MTQITKSTMIGELLQIDQNDRTNPFKYWNALLLGCPSSQMETVEEAAMGTRYRSGRSGKRNQRFSCKGSRLIRRRTPDEKGIPVPTGIGIPFFLLLNAAGLLKLCKRLKRMIFQNHLIVLFHERTCCRRIRLLRSIFG